MGQRNYMFDAFMLLSDNLTAYTTAQISKVAAANKILDFGGANPRTDLPITGAVARMDSAVVIDVSAMTLGATNLYDIFVMGSNVNTGANGVVLASMRLGNTAVMPNSGITSLLGRYEIMFASEQADINYEFVYLWVVPQGTTPSITFNAFVAQLPEI
jgi:hypothetical protein